MIRIREKHSCCGCQACAQICPKGCITMTADGEGFLYPVVDEAACVQCGLCEKVCPVLHTTEKKKNLPKAYAAYNLDEDVRLASSSGGVFTLLAEYVLGQDGIIYGAAMDGIRVKHVRVADREDLQLLRGSKYVQSDIGQTYIQAKDDLDAGKTVLFTGTPCQIEGLKMYLRKGYETLITMDIICHGVPSPMVWEKYVALQEKEAGASATRMFFRHKKYGWKDFAMLLKFANKTEYVCRHGEDLFMKAFLYDLCLRPSCYQCSFKKENRVSDITVADFWGIDEVCLEMDDDKGTSLVMVHTERGSEIFNRLFEKMRCREVDFTEATRYNLAMIRSVAMPKHRDNFMEKVRTGNLEELVRKYARDEISAKEILIKILAGIGLLEIAKKIKKAIR